MMVYFSWTHDVSDFANGMHRYLQAMEKQIDDLVHDQRLRAQTAATPHDHGIQHMLLGTMEETFPRNLRYGALVSTYATVEQSIRGACRVSGKELGTPFVEPRRGGMLEGAAAYLSRLLGVDIIDGRAT